MYQLKQNGDCESLLDLAREVRVSSLTSHSTHNSMFQGRVFPGNQLAMVLTDQSYGTQIKHKKPKQVNLTKPN